MKWNLPARLDAARCDPQTVFEAGLRLHHIANTAYPIAHAQTMREYRLEGESAQQMAAATWQGVDRFSLYVHIPFCEARCAYCEYTVVDPQLNSSLQDPYLRLVEQEIERYAERIGRQTATLVGLDIGGGTPALVSPAGLGRILDAARAGFHLPDAVCISIETTPKIAATQPDRLRDLYGLGIRRISMGVQTISARILAAVGRESTSVRYNREAAEAVRRAGFQKFNVDVMYGLAGQTLEALEGTLRHVISLEPEYITLYRMRFKGTRLIGQAQTVSMEDAHAQYWLAYRLLLECGYAGTPGKNTFSRVPKDPGTSDYLTERVIHGTPYLGVGLGAQTLSPTGLAYNLGAAEKSMGRYAAALADGLLPIQDFYHLSLPAALGKMISVSFYFGEINLGSFWRKFGMTLEQAFPDEVDFLVSNSLMHYTPHTLRLTEYGERHSAGVMALFYAGAVQDYLIRKTGGDG